MTPVVYASEVVFCFTLLSYLVVALVGAVCFAISVSYRLNPRYVLPEAFVSALSVLLFCFLADGIEIRYRGAAPRDFEGSLCFMPLWVAVATSAAMLALVVLWLVLVVKKRLSSLTAMSVKEALAVLPAGLCFYDETGRVLLLNEQIEEDCRIATGESLYDGKAFWANISGGKVAEGIRTAESEGSVIVERADGRVTLYKRIVHDFDGKTVFELSGTDISREFALKRETEQQNENLRKMNLRLRKYGEIVTEVTRERKILAARIKVHGNLGSLILRTKKSLVRGDCDREKLIAEWNDVLSLIFAPEDDESDKFSEADKTAASVGVRIFYEGKRPKKGTYAEKVFATAVFECVTNTARHADGDELRARMTETEKTYTITLTDNGKKPTGEIKEGGGLSSLRTITENAGGRMRVSGAPVFTVEIELPKEAQTDER